MRIENPTDTVTTQDLFVSSRDALRASGFDDPDIEAEVLIRHVLAFDRSQYFATLTDPIDRGIAEELEAIVNSRLAGKPLAYITGAREFYGLEFSVNSDVLIPRQETELIVDLALEYISNRLTSSAGPVLEVADVCAGSGAVGVAVAVNCGDVRIHATDISGAALNVAKRNAHAHDVADRMRFVETDLMSDAPGPYGLILCNPPYIPTGALDNLPIDVRNEPMIALDGGSDGLEVFRRLMIQSRVSLNPHGAIMIELMPEQMNTALEMAKETFPEAEVGYKKDLSGNPRTLTVYQEV